MDQGDEENRQVSTDVPELDNSLEARDNGQESADALEEIHAGSELVSDVLPAPPQIPLAEAATDTGIESPAAAETETETATDTGIESPAAVETETSMDAGLESAVDAKTGTDAVLDTTVDGTETAADPVLEPVAEEEIGGIVASVAMPEPTLPEADQAEQPEAAAPDRHLEKSLEVGSLVGPYVIERLLRSTPDEHFYLAVATDASGEHSSYFTLIERVECGFSASVVRLASMHLQLRHPRLLVPRAFFTLNGCDYLVVENLIGEDGQLAQMVSEGGRLPTVNTLTGGVGLADALSYMHRNGMAHLHISPDSVAIFNGRAYLTGLEQVSYFDPQNADSASLIARDANFLARTLAVIGDVPPEEVPGEDLAQDNLRRIAVHGASDAFESPGELANACGVALESVVHVLPNLMSDTPASITLEVGSATTVGRVRSQNQDACASATFDVTDDRTEGTPVGIFLVADGMGGEARGEWASRIAARLVLGEMAAQFALPSVTEAALDLDDSSPEASSPEAPSSGAHRDESGQGSRDQDEMSEMSDLTKKLVLAVERANQQVRELAEKLGKVTGTTLTAIAVQGQHASLAHLGDSRAYLLRGDMMVKLTEDHSLLARLQMLDHPILSEPDMFIPRNTLYRSLGQEEETVPDTLEFMLDPNDRLLICSDGLWDELDAQALAQTLAGTSNPRDCSEQLVRMANAAGGNDNSTALTIFVHAVPGDADRLAAGGR